MSRLRVFPCVQRNPHAVGSLCTTPAVGGPAATGFPSTSHSQAIHSISTPRSTRCPQVAHILCTRVMQAARITLPSDSGHERRPQPWVQTAPQLGITVGTTVDDCGQIERRPNPSTDAPSCPPSVHTLSPQAQRRPDLRERALSTQSTTPITTAVFSSSLEENKTKTGEGRIWGQPVSRVVLSTKARGGRGDVDPGDGLTWVPAPGLRVDVRSRPRTDRTHLRGTWPSRSPAEVTR
ncbi:Putative secreted protein [Amycolatopsis japonica]|uniref:Putative secreted protein n=1 Tax=Amycolatopsis japonica TaxID=208439 RepID=A0A075UJ74_9PSEU|nr:Putative secreted protein [Amycolatopsis japonica]